MFNINKFDCIFIKKVVVPILNNKHLLSLLNLFIVLLIISMACESKE